MSVKFSVIVPIYNSAKYLKECVDSVLNQNYDNYEVILINDGSTDNSYTICKEYEKAYNQVRVYTKQNEGLSATRNFGIDVSTGEYIVFLDSDDYIEKESLYMFNKIIETTSADVVSCYSSHFDENGIKHKSRFFLQDVDEPQSGVEFFRKSIYQNNYRVCAPFYITSKKLIEKKNLRFEVGIFHEDELWTPMLLFYAEKVVDLKYYFYNYRTSNIQSITRDPHKKEKRALDRIEISLKLALFFDKKNETIYSCFHDNIAAQYMYAIYDGNLAYNKYDINRFFPLKHARTAKYVLKSILFAISPRLTCKLRNYKK